MVTFANAKINLGLHVLERREDGYHNLETVFYPIRWCDGIEVVKQTGEPFSFNSIGLKIDGELEQNLCYKAWHLLSQKYELPPLQIILQKVIPMGAGLGGGSSDAACVLKLINQVVKLDISDNDLMLLAQKLGSDCPFFIRNEPMLARGRGEILSPISINLDAYKIVVVMPPLTVSTSEAYGLITPKKPAVDLTTVINADIFSWKDNLHNDFEVPIFNKYPLLKEIKEELYNQGAIYAAMSGSGAAIYGIFNKDVVIPQINNCIVWESDSPFNV